MDTSDWKNKLYLGDNLDILRNYVSDESVDLIYLDPPFNSNATYNVLFQEKSGEKSAAQITAFEDTWHGGQESEYAYQEIVRESPKKLADLIQAFRMFLGQNDMMAYLTMMAQRMSELHRVLKPAGSIYLHCDPTASHYLKLLMDAVFGVENFRNEIAWRRTHAHSGGRRYGPVHDTLLYYSKSNQYVWNSQYIEYSEEYKESFFRFTDTDGRRYRATILTGSGTIHGRFPE
jgi:adenine specific DNA methylase Mod